MSPARSVTWAGSSNSETMEVTQRDVVTRDKVGQSRRRGVEDCKSFGVMGIVTEAIPKSDRPQDKTPGPASVTPPLTWVARAPVRRALQLTR